MLNSVKNAITSAPRRVCSGASNALKAAKEKVGAFHARTVKPRLDSLKNGFNETRSSLRSKYEQLRNPQSTPLENHTATTASPKGFSEELAALRTQLEAPEDGPELMQAMTRLAGKAQNMKDLGELVMLMDYILGDGKVRDLKGFKETLLNLPFLKDEMDSIRENLGHALSQKNHSYQGLNQQLRTLLDAMALESNFEKRILKNLSTIDIKNLPAFILSKKDEFPPAFNDYNFQNALERNKNLSSASILDLISTKSKFLEMANANGLNEAIKDTVDQSLMGVITKSMSKGFADPLPLNLKAHIETMNIKELQQNPSLQNTVKWITAQYTNSESQKTPILGSQLIAMGKLGDVQLALFQMTKFKELGFDTPKNITDNLLEQLGLIEKDLAFLKGVAETQSPLYRADPLVPLAGALVKDIEAAKEEAAKGLDCTLDDLVVRAKNQLNIKQQASYRSNIGGFLEKVLKPRTKELSDLANDDNLEGIQELLSIVFKSKVEGVFKNPFSEEGLSHISFGTNPGELELKLIKEEGKSPSLEFTVHLGLDDKQMPKTASLPVSLKTDIKEQKDLASIKASVIKNREAKAERQLKELALLQVAADNKKDIDSGYDLETLKNTLINKEMQAILDAKLNEKAEKDREPGLQFKDAPQGPTPKKVLPKDFEPKSILKEPKNEAGADEAIYQEALKAATEKVEADLKAYIKDNQESLNSDYLAREPQSKEAPTEQ